MKLSACTFTAAFLPPRKHPFRARRGNEAISGTKCVRAMSFVLTRNFTARIA